MDERNLRPVPVVGRKERRGRGGFSIFQPAPPPHLPFNPSLARSKVISLAHIPFNPPSLVSFPERERVIGHGAYRSVPPFFFYEREKRSSAWNPSLPPSLFHRSSAWDLPFNPPERVIGQVPYRSTSFFYERERGHQPGPTVQPPPLWFGYPERERVIGHGAYRSTLGKETSSDGQKRNPVFFFFFASPNTHRPIYK